MKVSSGIASKTNVGQDINSSKSHINSGSPDLDSEITEYGTIIDIRYIDDKRESGNGFYVKLLFDKQYLNDDEWYQCEEPYEKIIIEYGNKTAFLMASPRFAFKFHPTKKEAGMLKIVSSPKQEKQYKNYQKNETTMTSSAVISFSAGAKPPGY